MTLNEPKKTRELYELTLSIDPFDSETHFNLATLIYTHFKDFNNAIVNFEQSIELNPSAIAFQNYGLLLKDKLAQPDNAKIQFEKGLILEPTNKILLKQLGLLYQDDYKDFLRAKVYFDKFIVLNPNSHDHYFYTLFLLLMNVKEYKPLARDHYKRACQLNPSLQDSILEQMMN
ncbi:hypothetical protein [Pedobacter immunditicola]|uniref:hypothetical protein n=1 Tax=Pedobacter immunditicola TaxID=3133440 RepID=UPI0030B18290